MKNDNINDLNAEIRKEVERHVMTLNRIAKKYNRKVIELLIGDCVSSTATLIDMGYGNALADVLDKTKERHNIR